MGVLSPRGLTMAFHKHLLLTLPVLLLFSILAVSAEESTMTCSRRWENPQADPRDRRAVPDGRRITINATAIIITRGNDFSRWDEPERRQHQRTGEVQTTFRIRVPDNAVTSTRGTAGPPINPEECYIDYHGPSDYNFQQGSVGSTWCKNCLNNGRKRDNTNTIANDDWTETEGWRARRMEANTSVRTALTAKLRQLTTKYPARTTTTTARPRRTTRARR